MRGGCGEEAGETGGVQEERACGKVCGNGEECWGTWGGVEGVPGEVRWEGFYGGGRPGREHLKSGPLAAQAF